MQARRGELNCSSGHSVTTEDEGHQELSYSLVTSVDACASETGTVFTDGSKTDGSGRSFESASC